MEKGVDVNAPSQVGGFLRSTIPRAVAAKIAECLAAFVALFWENWFLDHIVIANGLGRSEDLCV